jgi:hypothetical protein
VLLASASCAEADAVKIRKAKIVAPPICNMFAVAETRRAVGWRSRVAPAGSPRVAEWGQPGQAGR